jgi:methylated-DNA-[protein]-cysteine S-methyltransferase
MKYSDAEEKGKVGKTSKRIVFEYHSIRTLLGTITLIWYESGSCVRILRVLLPTDRLQEIELVRGEIHSFQPGSNPVIQKLGYSIERFSEGEPVIFGLDMVDWDQCTDFQRRVLMAEHGIPRGRVSTYGRIANHLGVPGGARAVGNALARNPFPIIIPCHRAIRSDGSLGGFRGGLKMKRALLEMEGISFSRTGAVSMRSLHY